MRWERFTLYANPYPFVLTLAILITKGPPTNQTVSCSMTSHLLWLLIARLPKFSWRTLQNREKSANSDAISLSRSLSTSKLMVTRHRRRPVCISISRLTAKPNSVCLLAARKLRGKRGRDRGKVGHRVRERYKKKWQSWVTRESRIFIWRLLLW